MKRSKHTFRFGGHSFTTKKAATEAIRKVLYDYKPGESLKEEDASFMADVLEHHPEAAMKIGCGVRSFRVENNHPTMGFWITRSDGTRTDFSFYSCLTHPTPEMDPRKAFRTEVRDQLVAFKTKAFSSSAQLACAVTGALLTSDRCHVDHYEPTFLELTEQFLASRRVAIADVQVEPTLDGSTETRLLDREFANAWAEFHTRARSCALFPPTRTCLFCAAGLSNRCVVCGGPKVGLARVRQDKRQNPHFRAGSGLPTKRQGW